MAPGSEYAAASSSLTPAGSASSLWPASSLSSTSRTNYGQQRPGTTTTVSSNTHIHPTAPPRSSSLPFTSTFNSTVSASISTSTIPAMGQSFSKSNYTTLSPNAPPPSPSTSNAAQRGFAAVANGLKLKRAFAGKRKKSEDVSRMDRSASNQEPAAHHILRQQQQIQATPSSASSPGQLMRDYHPHPQYHQQQQQHQPVALPNPYDQRPPQSLLLPHKLPNPHPGLPTPIQPPHPPSLPNPPTQSHLLLSPYEQQSQPLTQPHSTARQLTQLATQVFSSKKASSKSPTQSRTLPEQFQSQRELAPPPLPPKPTQSTSSGQLRPPLKEVEMTVMADHRSSIIPISPGISSAVTYMRMEAERESMESIRDMKKGQAPGAQGQTSANAVPQTQTNNWNKEQNKSAMDPAPALDKALRSTSEPEPAFIDSTKTEMKDSWRKSDSTMSHRTIRANSRPSRPVSMAESLQSNHTIVPGATPSKRQSALVDDADFGMPEEEDTSDSEKEGGDSASSDMEGVDSSSSTDLSSLNTTPDMKSSPTGVDATRTPLTPRTPSTPTPPALKIVHEAQPKTRDRRSMSLNIMTEVPTNPKHKLPPTPVSASAANLTFSSSNSNFSPSHINPQALQHTTSPLQPRITAITAIPARPFNPTISTNVSAQASNKPTPPTPSSSASLSLQPSHHYPHVPASSRSAPVPIQHPRNTPQNPYTAFPPPPEPVALTSPGPRLRPPKKSGTSHGLGPGDARPESRMDRSLPALPPTPVRQPAMSMTGGLGLAKRAVERMFGVGSGSSSSNTSSHGHGHTQSQAGVGVFGTTSGYSSSSSGGGMAPSSYSRSVHGHNGSTSSVYDDQARTSSDSHHGGGGGGYLHNRRGGSRHPAGAQSISSLTSSANSANSDSEPEARVGPSLGKRLRGPVRRNAASGVVFGRDLKSVVRETGVGVGLVGGKSARGWAGKWRGWEGGEASGDEGTGDSGKENEDKEVEKAVWSRKGSVRKGQLKALEERKLPAIVVRCAQHLLIWGVQEEGLFRIPGRAFHVSRLRAEFDSGADFDMTECSPGDLDPHAVASVFKAFLRELPEPILTNALLPYFEAAMAQETSTNAASDDKASTSRNSRAGFPGLPTGPRSPTTVPTMRKPPSLSTLAMPAMTGLKPASKSLINAFHALLNRLPEENRDLVRTVTELIRATAKDSKETKMPLSNLLLVFCPSLNMNPPLLRVLCEAEGLWEVPVMSSVGSDAVIPIGDVVLDISKSGAGEEGMEDDDGERESLLSESVGRTSEDVPSSVEYHASTEDISRQPQRDAISPKSPKQNYTRKRSLTASALDDGSSYQSTSEDLDNLERNYSDIHSQNVSPQPLTSSAESLATPATSSGHASHLQDEGGRKMAQRVVSPVIADSAPMGLSPTTPRRPLVSNPIRIATAPVQFPMTSPYNVPPSPVRLEKRRSIPILSLPNMSFGSPVAGPDSPSGSSLNRPKRMKKPSLQLLFSKKSSSSLSSPKATSSPAGSLRPVISSPYLITPNSSSGSSVSTPISAVTAPQSSTFTLPPKIETPIESSSLRFSVGVGIKVVPPTSCEGEQLESAHEKSQGGVQGRASSNGSRPLPVPHGPRPSLANTAASASVTSLVPPNSTPIADRYNRSASPSPSMALASKSQLSIASPDEENDTIPLPASHLRPYPARSRLTSTSSKASSNHLGLLAGDPEEDWTQSVLLAADLNVNSGWTVEQSA